MIDALILSLNSLWDTTWLHFLRYYVSSYCEQIEIVRLIIFAIKRSIRLRNS